MVFKKSFPHTKPGTTYPSWEEISLDDSEEEEQENLAREDNVKKMSESIFDAKKIIEQNNLKPYQTDMIHIAISLFEKRASHEIYYKENKAKEKFDKKFQN